MQRALLIKESRASLKYAKAHLNHSAKIWNILEASRRFFQNVIDLRIQLNALFMRHAYANQDKCSCKLWAH